MEVAGRGCEKGHGGPELTSLGQLGSGTAAQASRPLRICHTATPRPPLPLPQKDQRTQSCIPDPGALLALMPCPVLGIRLDPWLASARPHPEQSCPGVILRRRELGYCAFDDQGLPFWPVEKLLRGGVSVPPAASPSAMCVHARIASYMSTL